MAKKTEVYPATIMENGELTEILVDGERNIILKQMQSENNTDKLMALTRGMAHNLERKKELEEMLVALHEMNKKLIGWQSNLDKQK